MKREELLLALDEILEVEPGTLNGTEHLEGLEGWNSLAIISFMALADEMSAVSLQPRQIAACNTVADLASLVNAQMQFAISNIPAKS